MEETSQVKRCKDCVYYKEEGIYQGECRYYILYGTSTTDGGISVEFDNTCEHWEEEKAEKRRTHDNIIYFS